MNFVTGNTAYIAESNYTVREVQILRQSGNFVTVKFLRSGGAITVRKSRLFETQQEAMLSLPKKKIKERDTHYDYESRIDLIRG